MRRWLCVSSVARCIAAHRTRSLLSTMQDARLTSIEKLAMKVVMVFVRVELLLRAVQSGFIGLFAPRAQSPPIKILTSHVVNERSCRFARATA